MAETITYDEVAEWWENSEWYMSTYPPSTWHEFCEAQGYTLEDLQDRASEIEAMIEAHQNEDDGRTCECEWAEHERECTWLTSH